MVLVEITVRLTGIWHFKRWLLYNISFAFTITVFCLVFAIQALKV